MMREGGPGSRTTAGWRVDATYAAIRRYVNETSDVLRRLSINDVARLIEALHRACERGSQVFVFGNGGSGATASHFACDINKGVSTGLQTRFRVICLNDNVPIMLAYANDFSYQDIFLEQLKNFLRPDDVVMGISASGNSENVLRAVGYAREAGAVTIGLTGFDGGRLIRVAELALVVPSHDMQQVEDAHLVVIHTMMQALHAIVRSGQETRTD